MVEVIRLGGPLGAEVRGIDPAHALRAADLAKIEEAFLENLVLVFRGAPMSARQLSNFSQNFGELQPHIAKRYQHPEVPEVVINTNQDAQGNYDKLGAERGVGWHSDLPYDQVPARATLLHAVNVPSHGGNTAFANMYMAYETMPAALKNKIEGRYALFCLGGRNRLTQGILEDPTKVPHAIHPVIRVHPETGRKSVYVNPYHTHSIIGMPRAQSDELLDEVYAWCERPQFQWEQEWRVADTIIWENRCAWHTGKMDYPQHEPRLFLRTTVRGTPTMPPEQLKEIFASVSMAASAN